MSDQLNKTDAPHDKTDAPHDKTEVPHELSVSRYIDAPPSVVWKIMTERLPEWWCPKPWRTEVEALEWRAGGRIDATMYGPEEGDVSPMQGVVLEVVPEKRFVFTDAFVSQWRPQGPFMVGVFALEPEGDGTRYTASARHWTEAACQQHEQMGFQAGWSTVAEQLAALAESQ